MARAGKDTMTAKSREGETLEPPPDALNSLQLLIETLNSLPLQIAVVDASGRITTANQAWFDFAMSECVDSNIGLGSNYLEASGRATCCAEAGRSISHGLRQVLDGTRDKFTTEFTCRSPSDKCWLYMTVVPVHRRGFSGAVIAIENVTERHGAEEAVRDSEVRFRALAENAQDVIYRYRHHPAPSFEYVSPAILKMTGYSPEDFYSDPDFDLRLAHEEDFETVRQLKAHPKARPARFAMRWRRKDGKTIWIELNTVPVKGSAGQVTATEAIVRDITGRVHAQEKAKELATHDSLTGLPNRLLLRDRIDQAIVQAHRERKNLALFFIDLDEFKPVNDTMGHAVGDLLLKAAADRLTGITRRADTVARLGGDEFVIVQTGVNKTADSVRLAEKVVAAFCSPFRIAGRHLHVGCSVGIAVAPGSQAVADDIIEQADMAMYRAKIDGGSNYQFYDEELNTQVRERRTLARELRRALKRDELVLHYLPRIDIQSQRVRGVEALVRWSHPQRGLLLPTDFLSVAQVNGLMGDVGDWVLQRACVDYRSWPVAKSGRLKISVNVTHYQLSELGYAQRVSEILGRIGPEPGFLELEIPEHLLEQDIEAVVTNVGVLRQQGVSVSVDDFGTGLSSMTPLQRIGADSLKIDNAIVHEMIAKDGSRDGQVAKAVISLGHSLNLKVVAEGVETPEQLAYLDDLGCDEVQGFLLCRPLEAREVPGFLQSRELLSGEKPVDRGEQNSLT